MKKLSILLISVFLVISCSAQLSGAFKSLDTKNPIVFGGDYIVYKGNKIRLGPKAFFISGQFTDEEVSKYKYVYNSVSKASKYLTDGNEESPMVLYIAPYVYWIDDPDDPAIRIPESESGTPFGLQIHCEWLKFYGLSDDARNVVLACNRGQTMGATGNFTMFRISGQGTSVENITFGNYCNIDLEYPLKPELNREKRGSAIVQAQLIFCNGDKIVARNARFVSRLNLCPFVGGKRVLFDHCHFESTDDALNGSAIYLNCTLDFYSGKPFAGTYGTGAVFFNCDITCFTRGKQYLTKMGGQVVAVDTRFHSETVDYFGWKDIPNDESRNYQYNVQCNGETVVIGKQHPELTVDMAGKAVLDAYRFEYNGRIIYNTYNLLRGNDDWDPMAIKELVFSAEKERGKSFINLPVQVLISPTQDTIETGKDSIILRTKVNKFGNFELKGEQITWKIDPEFESFVDLMPVDDGSCKVIPTNESNNVEKVVITVKTSSGLETASVLYVSPPKLESPKFSMFPKIINKGDGKLSVDYKLDMKLQDQSLVNWYRCADSKGKNPIEIAVSRMNRLKLEYVLSPGDIGYYILATVAPKHNRCDAGKPVSTITDQPVDSKDIHAIGKILIVDGLNMSTKYQPEIIPGFWTIDSYAPADTHGYHWEADNSRDPWYYGVGTDGAANDTGLIQAVKGARLRYTPVGKEFGDMKITFTAVPAKTAGQGFSSARAQYMDVCIKFDAESLTGYALRLIRTTKYSDAIDFILMKYDNGNVTAISGPVSASCYRPDCYITVEVKGNTMLAHAESPAEYYVQPGQPEVVKVVNMKSEIVPNKYGGFGFQHTGTVGSGATLIKDVKVEWL
jgi:hypothetical protein